MNGRPFVNINENSIMRNSIYAKHNIISLLFFSPTKLKRAHTHTYTYKYKQMGNDNTEYIVDSWWLMALFIRNIEYLYNIIWNNKPFDLMPSKRTTGFTIALLQFQFQLQFLLLLRSNYYLLYFDWIYETLGEFGRFWLEIWLFFSVLFCFVCSVLFFFMSVPTGVRRTFLLVRVV